MIVKKGTQVESNTYTQSSPPEYTAEVAVRTFHKDPTVTRWGTTIYSDLVQLQGSDGNTVVRELTMAIPDEQRGPVSPYPIVETDPWTTGERGFNRERIEAYTKLGYNVLWLHHGGRYSPIAKDKSVSRSAHQMHAVLNSLSANAEFATDQVIVNGYSRGAMTADKFIAQAEQYNRRVVYSDTEAPCFAIDMNSKEKLSALVRQVPGEAVGIGNLVFKIVKRAIDENNPSLLAEYVQTLDMHPRNLVQEALWAHALVNSNVGYSTKAMPRDAVGVRTFFTGDTMSQISQYHDLYNEFPNLQVLIEKGPHVAGAFPEYQVKKQQRMKNLMDIIQDNNMSLTGALIDTSQPKYGSLRSVA